MQNGLKKACGVSAIFMSIAGAMEGMLAIIAVLSSSIGKGAISSV